MDKRTRVLTAMNEGEVDHVPAGFWFHFAGEEATGEACINAHLKYYRETDLDLVKIMCDGYFPWPIREEIQCAADWKKLKPLEVLSMWRTFRWRREGSSLAEGPALEASRPIGTERCRKGLSIMGPKRNCKGA